MKLDVFKVAVGTVVALVGLGASAANAAAASPVPASTWRPGPAGVAPKATIYTTS